MLFIFFTPFFLQPSYLILTTNHIRIVPHDKPVGRVQLSSVLGQQRILQTELVVPFRRHEFASLSRLTPDLGKIAGGAEILGHPDRVTQIEHGVPPSVRNKDGLAGVLSKLVTGEVVIVGALAVFRTVLDSWQYRHEVMNRLVVFAVSYQVFSLGHLFGDLRRKQHPPFLTDQQRVPCGRRQRIDVERGTGTFRSHQEPAVGRSP
mmetsp:Transcript_9442/g.14577  ORF Transcript_9442/g.14577 Transcript_9442/m.14577 type:complete len:205 (+) Transcript_9442:232-846(+)